MRSGQQRALLFVPLFAALVILSPLLAEDRRFHPDEAFFMTFARDAAVMGDWWLSGPLDKPPLTVYANALLLTLIGMDTLPNGVLTLDAHQGEFVGRLAAFFSGLIVVALSVRLTLDHTAQPLAAIGAGVTLSALPLFQLYSASAFMDMPMIALAFGALLAARRRRGGWSGLLLGLAVCAKPQAVFFAPLVLWYVVCAPERWTCLMRWGVGLSSALLALGLWDALRAGQSVILLGMANNDSFQLAASVDVLLARLQAWLPITPHMPHVPLLTWALIAVSGLCSRPTRPLSVWLLSYGLGHLLIFEVLYERYLLPLVVVGVVSAWAAAAVCWRGHAKHATPHKTASRLASLLVLTALGGGLMLANSYPLHKLEDYRCNSQIDRLASDLNALPVATVIYDHWLGWLLNYYMGPWHNKRIVYYPSPEVLIAGIRSLNEYGPRYVLIPTDAATHYGLSSDWSTDWATWLSALENAFYVEELGSYGAIRVFRVYPN
ncbi:hypothetical protein VZO05_01560 [Aggregatilineales bacterium SYSU G02658]